MSNRVIMTWLVICILGYGSVYAFDGHIDEQVEHQAVAGDRDHEPEGDEGHPSCDHCCHASAHITAIWACQTAVVCPDAGTGYTPYLHTLSFNTICPPERPPKAES